MRLIASGDPKLAAQCKEELGRKDWVVSRNWLEGGMCEVSVGNKKEEGSG